MVAKRMQKVVVYIRTSYAQKLGVSCCKRGLLRGASGAAVRDAAMRRYGYRSNEW